jgi:hypothetical protein
MSYKRKELDVVTLQTCRASLDHPPICDFCGDPHPMFIYAASRMSSGLFTDCWRWCACWTCSHAIENREWDLIEATMVIKLRKTMSSMIPATYIMRAVHKALEEFHTYAIRQ